MLFSGEPMNFFRGNIKLYLSIGIRKAPKVKTHRLLQHSKTFTESQNRMTIEAANF